MNDCNRCVVISHIVMTIYVCTGQSLIAVIQLML